jgi:hypothetical protein
MIGRKRYLGVSGLLIYLLLSNWIILKKSAISPNLTASLPILNIPGPNAIRELDGQ